MRNNIYIKLLVFLFIATILVVFITYAKDNQPDIIEIDASEVKLVEEVQESENKEMEIIQKDDENLEPYFYLKDTEKELLYKAVMAEARGESFEGQKMIVQCILDGAIRNDFDIEDLYY